MRKLAFLTGALIFAAGAPAAAQYQTRYYSGGDISGRIEWLDDRLEREIETGRISNREADAIRRDLRSLRNLERQYGRDGVSQWERAELQRRIESIRSQLQYAARYEDSRGAYGGGDYSDARDGGEDRWNGRTDDRYDRYDRNNRYNGDERYDPDDRYDDSDGGWREDDRSDDAGYDQSSYHGVPSRYRDQYRDTGRTYFRYRDGYIYQFDRESGRVVNTHWIGRH